MAKNTPLNDKLKAIEAIVKALEKLEQEDRQEVANFALKQAGVLKHAGVDGSETDGVGTNRGVDNVNVSIDRFVSGKKPLDQYQRVAVLAYYLKYKEKIDEFKNKQLTDADIKARQPKRIINMADVIAKARARYGFLTKGRGPATQQLTTLGEDVVRALPDQSVVKQLTDETKSRKPRRGTKKDKKA